MVNAFKSACVTGGAGFIGSRLVRRLLDRNLEVRVLDDLSVGRKDNVPKKAKLVEGDILDPRACEKAMAGCDILFHLAARVAIRSSFEFVVEDTLCNVTGTATVLRAAANTGTVRRVVSASTMGVYADSPTPTPISENHPTVPLSPYGVSKLALEQLTHRVAAAAELESVVLRLFNTYGPGQRLSPYVGVITIFVNLLCAGKPPTIYGDGLQVRDFVHVDDVVSGFVAAMDARSISGETVNIGTGRPHTVNGVAETLSRILGSQLQPVHLPAVAGELRNAVASVEKAKQLLAYNPIHEFESAIASVVAEIAPQTVDSQTIR